MKAVPAVQQPAQVAQEEIAAYRIGDGWLTPERLARRKVAAERMPEELEAARSQWEAENKEVIEAFNERARKIGSMGRRIHEWRKAKAEREAAESQGKA
ncbi:MAG: hypothetical protein ACRECD_00595 [Burkholderiaceae bacterium]